MIIGKLIAWRHKRKNDFLTGTYLPRVLFYCAYLYYIYPQNRRNKKIDGVIDG